LCSGARRYPTDTTRLSDRREIHLSIATAIESTLADRIDEFVERLAVHYREGGDRNKAVEYLIRAGERVASDYSHRSALDYYLKALDLLHNVPHPDTKRILSLYLPIGRLAVTTNMIAMGIEKMRLAEELAEELGDKRALVEILRITAELQARSDHFASQQYFQHAIELADEPSLAGALSALNEFSVIYQPAAGDAVRTASAIGHAAQPRY
jgi:predicted ATPase